MTENRYSTPRYFSRVVKGSRFLRPIAAWAMFILIMGLCFSCRNENYFGPYRLGVPTEINERSEGRTFRMPLSHGERQQREQLSLCETNEPDRLLPCRCDYPVFTVGEKLVRLDYRLNWEENAVESVNVTVWIGIESPPDADLPDVLPDLPQIEVLSEHLHVLKPNTVLNESFLESEWTEMEQAWTNALFPECIGWIGSRPAPFEIVVGMSTPADSQAMVRLDFTVRVRGGR